MAAQRFSRSRSKITVNRLIIRFALVNSSLVEFQQQAGRRPDLIATQDVYNRVMIKDNIATITHLRSREGTNIVVGNAHLQWDPVFKDVKLVQTAILMEELATFTRHIKNPTIIVAGDFNSLPDSGVYEFISTSTLSNRHSDFSNHIYGNYTRKGLSHEFNLKSAYSNLNAQFTNYTPTFKGVIDYIFYSSHTCQVTGTTKIAVFMNRFTWRR